MKQVAQNLLQKNIGIKKCGKSMKKLKTTSDTKYTSDCPSVATVNKYGQVKAVAPGTATIYIQDIGGPWCKTTVTVK